MESRIERHRKPDSIKIDCDTTHIFSGVRNIIIKKIGRNATITTSDSFKGRIVIQGDVGKDVQFNLNGEGNIKFKTAPPSSVLNSINFLGTFDISTPPRISSSNDWAQQNREKGYSYDRYSDSRRDRRPDSRYLRDREVTLSSLSIRTSNLTDENNKPEPLLNAYLPSTQAYINSFKGKKSNLEMLDKLELSKKEEQQLEKYMDPITCVLMNRPVTLNGILYDLDTLIMLLNTKNEDPYSKYIFFKRDIQPARNESETLQTIIQGIIKAHAQQPLEGNLEELSTNEECKCTIF